MGSEGPVKDSSLLGVLLPFKGKDKENPGYDFDVHDSHREWTKKYVEHYETGVVIHVTSGNVQHVNFNLYEAHATANFLTMHVDFTPLNVHFAQKWLALDVHIAPSKKHGHWNVGGGGHHTLVGEIHQEAQAVRITSTQRELGFADKLADVSHAPAQRGNMTLEADGVMSLRSNASINLESPYAGTVSLKLNDPPGQAILRSTTTIVEGTTEARIAVGGSSANVQAGNISLNNGQQTTVILNGATLTTGATNTYLNGRVHIGDPAVPMATQAAVNAINQRIENDLATKAQIAALQQQIQLVSNKLPKGKGG